MILADRRAIRLGQHQTHEVVRLRILRRYTHGVTGVTFGLSDITPAEEKERQFIGGPEIIGFKRHDAPDQRCARSGL